MIYRQPTGLPWDARSIIFVQPSGELLLAREFGRGVDPFPPYPNGQTLEGGTEGWAIWDPNDVGGAAWVDAGRQAGMLEVAALDDFGRGFTGPYVAAPAVPAGAETYAYTAYGRPFQVDSLSSVDEMIEARFGLFLAFADLPADGAFVLAGVATLADDTPQPLTAARNVWVSPAGDDSNAGTIGSPWLTIARVGTDLLRFTQLQAPYTIHLSGTGNVANSDLTIPRIIAGLGAFDVICDSEAVLAGPFTLTAPTALNGTTLTVAAGLGVDTWRGRSVRFLTGDAAATGYRSTIYRTTDTVATVGALYDAGAAIGDTFDVIEPAVSLTGIAQWVSDSQTIADGYTAVPVLGLCYLKGVKFTGHFTLNGGAWAGFGVTSSAQFDIAGAVLLGGTYPDGPPIARLGMLALSAWYNWGFMKPVTPGSAFIVTRGGQFVGTLVSANLTVGTPNPIVGYGGASFSGAVAVQVFEGNIFGATGNNIPTVDAYQDCLVGCQIGGGTSTQSLVRCTNGTMVLHSGARLAPGASNASFIQTLATGCVVVGTVTPTGALPAVGSFGCDARKGGSIRWLGLPNLVGAAGDTIVDVANVANAFYAAGGIGVANAAMGGVICRQQ